jgi:hypothetical protein
MALHDASHKPDPIERDFLDAVQRLVEGKPENKKLKAKAKAGKVKINISNAALEAGHSRTLIALEDCRYPKVREVIHLAQGGKTALPTTYTQLISNLRADIATQKAEKRLLETSMAAHVLARRKAEINARRDAAEAALLRKKIVELEKIAHLPRRDGALPRLVLIRGLPGSGKTTKAMGYVNDGYMHFEADQCFLVDGKYEFDSEKLPQAHAWCLAKAREALERGEFVCVANVFATLEDIKPYTELDVDYQIVEANYPGQSTHEVPPAKLRGMKSTWVPTDQLLEAFQRKPSTNAKVTPITSKKKKG